MFINLLYLSLAAIPFIFMANIDFYDVKTYTALIFSLALFLAQLYESGLKPIKHKWLLLFLLYIPVNMILSPKFNMMLSDIPVSNIWLWKPCAKLLIYSLFLFSVISHEFKEGEIDRCLNVIIWAGFLNAIYTIFQYLKLDQIFEVIEFASKNGNVGGFIGNPDILSPYLAMIIPLAIYLKKWFKLSVLVIAIVLANCQLAWITATIGTILYFSFHNLGRLLVGFIAIIILACATLTLISENKYLQQLFNDNGRFNNWVAIVGDLHRPPIVADGKIYPLTGHGIGSFKFLYRKDHPDMNGRKNMLGQAHNEYFEVIYDLGLAGIIIFLMVILTTLFPITRFITPDSLVRALFSSVAISMLSACGIFLWQVGVTAFLTVLIIGLLINLKENERCQIAC